MTDAQHIRTPTEYPELAGHRGYPFRYPENTLIGYQAALSVGASMIECDVQLTRDLVPVVLHDADFERTAGVNERVFDLRFDELASISVHEPSRFGERYAGTPVSSLQALLELVAASDEVTLLVEIKSESIDHHKLDAVMPVLLNTVSPFVQQVIVISLHAGALEWLKVNSELRIGYVIETWDEATRLRAEAMVPELMLCHHRLVAEVDTLWQGPWEWMLYGVETIELAKSLKARGVAYVETDDIGGMISATGID